MTCGQIRFARRQACAIAGLEIEALEAWEASARRDPEPEYDISGVVALMALRDALDALGGRVDLFRLALAQALAEIAREPSVRRLARRTVIVGPDFGRLCDLGAARLTCPDRGFFVLRLQPLIAELQDRVFA